MGCARPSYRDERVSLRQQRPLVPSGCGPGRPGAGSPGSPGCPLPLHGPQTRRLCKTEGAGRSPGCPGYKLDTEPTPWRQGGSRARRGGRGSAGHSGRHRGQQVGAEMAGGTDPQGQRQRQRTGTAAESPARSMKTDGETGIREKAKGRSAAGSEDGRVRAQVSGGRMDGRVRGASARCRCAAGSEEGRVRVQVCHGLGGWRCASVGAPRPRGRRCASAGASWARRTAVCKCRCAAGYEDRPVQVQVCRGRVDDRVRCAGARCRCAAGSEDGRVRVQVRCGLGGWRCASAGALQAQRTARCERRCAAAAWMAGGAGGCGRAVGRVGLASPGLEAFPGFYGARTSAPEHPQHLCKSQEDLSFGLSSLKSVPPSPFPVIPSTT